MIRENSYLNDEQVDELKNILLAEKERILNKSVSNESIGCMDKDELVDPLDEASINIQTSQDLRMRNRENFYLKKINKALNAVNRGEYGLCGECDIEIGFERLKARPTAELCISCKEESELSEKGNFFAKKSKSLGKTMQEMGGSR
jgi:DnaK suppressor protein